MHGIELHYLYMKPDILALYSSSQPISNGHHAISCGKTSVSVVLATILSALVIVSFL